MQVKTANLVGAALDWAVAASEGGVYQADRIWAWATAPNGYSLAAPSYSTDPTRAQPIIERERIATIPSLNYWVARIRREDPLDDWLQMNGPTPLIAAMRCWVVRKMGDVVDVPQEILDKVSEGA